MINLQKYNHLIDNKKPDYLLLFAASFLMIVGMIFSYSLSIYTVDIYNYSQFHFFIRQGIVAIFAIFIMWVFAHVKTEVIFFKWKIGWWLLGGFSLVMVLMPFLPASMVSASGGASRWIRLSGFSISPVEFFKIGFIFFLSISFHRKLLHLQKVSFLEELKILVPYGVIFSISVFLIAVVQKDLGNVVVLATIMFIMLIFAGRSMKLFAFLITIGLSGIGFLIAFAPHRIQRIQSWWSSVQDTVLSPFPPWIQEMLRVTEYSAPEQVSNSLNAMNNGGWFGEGLAEGGIKLGFLPEVHTDFVLAGIIEEVGLLGFAFITAVLFYVIMRIIRISNRIENPVYHLFSLGVALMISLSFLINAYGISGIIPIKGIAVPFLSYGGSSILSIGLAIGMVLSISKDIKPKTKSVS